MRPFGKFDEEMTKDYDIRTSLYGDVWLSKWELKLIHTRCFQRLYDIKQLGFADRVYPDATHCRFNHSLGVLEQADRIARWVVHNLTKKDGTLELAKQVRQNIDVIRMVALLHDVFHIPFGHTIEDELHFYQRHDEDSTRKIKILDSILAEILYWEFEAIYGANRELRRQFWTSYRQFDTSALCEIVKPLLEPLLKSYEGLDSFLTNFVKSCEILLFMGGGVIEEQRGPDFYGFNLEIKPMGHELRNIEKPTFNPLTEYYITDIIGNTISADLLDYALRDMRYTGLTASYDNRLLQYFTLVEHTDKVKLRIKNGKTGEGEVDERDKKLCRLALNLFDRRIRIDALSEILQILNLRYLLTERVLFHRTKCAVSAMLGKAFNLLELSGHQISEYMLCGDSEFLSYIENRAVFKLQEAITLKEESGIDSATDTLKLVQGIRSRHFYKPVFHMKSIPNLSPQERSHPAQLLAKTEVRAKIEKEIEEAYGFPAGSVIIYCPTKTHLKEAECLVVVDRAQRIKRVKDLQAESGFEVYGKVANNVAEKYGVLWNMYVFVPKRYICYWKPIEEKIVSIFNRYREQMEQEFPGIRAIEPDDDLSNYLATKKETVVVEYDSCNRKLGEEVFESLVHHEEQVTLDTAINQRVLTFKDATYVDRVKATIKNRIREGDLGDTKSDEL